MDILNERIMQDGKCFPGGILKVDSFINHQMDPTLMMQIAEEFKRIFSGIAPAILVGYLMRLPVVFIKKKVPKTMERMLVSTIHSFTKDRDYTVCVSNDYLKSDDHILFIDDFLAYGNAAMGVVDLVRQAGATIEGMGFIIEKAFQDGGERIKKEGIFYRALATVESLDDCKIVLRS